MNGLGVRESRARPSATTRQLETLRAYVRCGSREGAAHELHISPGTAGAHLAQLRARLGVHNEAQAVYLLWLGYEDHIAHCPHDDHVKCRPMADSAS